MYYPTWTRTPACIRKTVGGYVARAPSAHGARPAIIGPHLRLEVRLTRQRSCQKSRCVVGKLATRVPVVPPKHSSLKGAVERYERAACARRLDVVLTAGGAIANKLPAVSPMYRTPFEMVAGP